MKTTKSKIQLSKALFFLAFIISLTSVSPAAEGIWTIKADMPTARMLLGTCVLDGKIYAIGGAPRPHVGLSVVEVYDPTTDTWTKKANMLAARAGLGASVVNGKIYAIGGVLASGPSVEEYDPATDTWTRKADMPTKRNFLTTSVVDDKIYAIGGSVETDGPFFSTVEEYNPATDTWTRKADLPEPRYLHTAGVVNGKIYVIAGSPRNMTASNAVFEYDPATDAWTRKADAPTVRSWQSPTAGVVDGRIYVIGGDAGPPDAEVEEYDPATDTWTARADMPTPRGALSTVSLNDKIYVIGGTVTLFNDTLATVEEYFPNPFIVDFNGDGIVNTKEILRLIKSWDQDDPMCDIAPRPSGDGVVDALDLEFLMSYWGQPIDDPFLLAHWTLDETEGEIAYDSAGGNFGTLSGNPLWQPDSGQIAGALQFDGLDDYISTDKVLNPKFAEFSVFVWIKGGSPGQVIISQKNSFSGVGATWLGIDPLNGCLMTELVSPPIGRFIAEPLESNCIITDDIWHRVGFVWDGSYRTLYVDGIEVAKDNDPLTSLNNSDGGLYIGINKNRDTGTFFSGMIDDIRIYNRAVRP